MSRKFLSSSQLRLLSPQQLLVYKKELNQTFLDMQEEIEVFVSCYKKTKKILRERLEEVEKSLKSAEKDRLNLDVDSPISSADEVKLKIH